MAEPRLDAYQLFKGKGLYEYSQEELDILLDAISATSPDAIELQAAVAQIGQAEDPKSEVHQLAANGVVLLGAGRHLADGVNTPRGLLFASGEYDETQERRVFGALRLGIWVSELCQDGSLHEANIRRSLLRSLDDDPRASDEGAPKVPVYRFTHVSEATPGLNGEITPYYFGHARDITQIDGLQTTDDMKKHLYYQALRLHTIELSEKGLHPAIKR